MSTKKGDLALRGVLLAVLLGYTAGQISREDATRFLGLEDKELDILLVATLLNIKRLVAQLK